MSTIKPRFPSPGDSVENLQEKGTKIFLEGKATFCPQRKTPENRFWGESDQLEETRK
jgi:hypothetical protein